MLRIPGGIFSYLSMAMAFLLLLLVPNTHGRAVSASATGSNAATTHVGIFHATTPGSFRALSPSSTIFNTSSALKRDQPQERASKARGHIAYPIIIGLSVCVVISGGITYVYFRQRARVRRAAAATPSAAGDADPGECAEQDAPVMRSIHEDQAVPPRTSRSGEGG